MILAQLTSLISKIVSVRSRMIFDQKWPRDCVWVCSEDRTTFTAARIYSSSSNNNNNNGAYERFNSFGCPLYLHDKIAVRSKPVSNFFEILIALVKFRMLFGSEDPVWLSPTPATLPRHTLAYFLFFSLVFPMQGKDISVEEGGGTPKWGKYWFFPHSSVEIAGRNHWLSKRKATRLKANEIFRTKISRNFEFVNHCHL